MEIIVVSEPDDQPAGPPPRTDTVTDPPPASGAIERERQDRLAESAATHARIRCLEEALATASSLATSQLEALEAMRRRRQLWMTVIVLLVAAAALWRAILKDQGPEPSREAASRRTEPRQSQLSAADSALRRFARLPAHVETDHRAPPLPAGELANAAEKLGAALEMHPQEAWPVILDHIRETSGHSVCPFLWTDGALAFILPEAPLGISSLPAAMTRCAQAIGDAP